MILLERLCTRTRTIVVTILTHLCYPYLSPPPSVVVHFRAILDKKTLYNIILRSMEIFKCLATASSNIYAEAQAEDKTDSSMGKHMR
jgi:hypothetical protein